MVSSAGRMTPSSRLVERAADAAVLLGCWLFVVLLSTAQRWTWLNTPDSEFYASLGLFGSEVTDRTVTPVYYWTRLGTIAPVRLLTEVFGPWNGYAVYWSVLVAVVLTAVYVMVRRFAGRTVAATMALLVTCSTVVLAFLGNPYVTGTALAAMFVVISGTVRTLPPTQGEPGNRAWRGAAGPVTVGLAFGWLAMTNPNAMVMTLAVWLAATAVVTAALSSGRARHLLTQVVGTGIGALVSFGALWLAGRLIFPELDWLQTYLFWSRALDFGAYVGDAWAFTRDISMVVPLTIMVTVALVAIVRRHDPLVRVAAVLSPAAFGVTVLSVLATPNGLLEVGHYQALQWPPALSALALTVAAVSVGGRVSVPTVLAGVAAVGLVIVAGHWVGTMPLATGWMLAGLTALLLLGTVVWVTRGSGRSSAVGMVALLVAAGVLLAGFQLLQNSRRPTGVMAEGVYSNAFNANDTEARLVPSRDAQAWLIDETTREDTVMVWVDADWNRGEQTLLSMAAFQIWGANQVTPERTLDATGLANAQAARASVFAMYGKSRAAIVDFWSSIPREVGHSDPVCSSYPWPDPAVPEAYVCLTRLTWPQ